MTASIIRNIVDSVAARAFPEPLDRFAGMLGSPLQESPVCWLPVVIAAHRGRPRRLRHTQWRRCHALLDSLEASAATSRRQTLIALDGWGEQEAEACFRAVDTARGGLRQHAGRVHGHFRMLALLRAHEARLWAGRRACRKAGDTESAWSLKCEARSIASITSTFDEYVAEPAGCERARLGDAEGLRTLIEAGLRPDRADRDGCTPLFHAAQNGHVEVIDLLVRHGANPLHRCHTGATALHVAATGASNARAVSRLLECGCDVDATFRKGQTPLHLAAAAGSVDIARVLLEHGADVNSRTVEGVTPLLGVFDPAMARLLVKWGAGVDSRALDER